MGATSVTGTGKGESHGEAKPENHAPGCCGGSPPDETPANPIKKQCHTKYKTGGSSKYKANGGNSQYRTC